MIKIVSNRDYSQRIEILKACDFDILKLIQKKLKANKISQLLQMLFTSKTELYAKEIKRCLSSRPNGGHYSPTDSKTKNSPSLSEELEEDLLIELFFTLKEKEIKEVTDCYMDMYGLDLSTELASKELGFFGRIAKVVEGGGRKKLTIQDKSTDKGTHAYWMSRIEDAIDTDISEHLGFFFTLFSSVNRSDLIQLLIQFRNAHNRSLATEFFYGFHFPEKMKRRMIKIINCLENCKENTIAAVMTRAFKEKDTLTIGRLLIMHGQDCTSSSFNHEMVKTYGRNLEEALKVMNKLVNLVELNLIFSFKDSTSGYYYKFLKCLIKC